MICDPFPNRTKLSQQVVQSSFPCLDCPEKHLYVPNWYIMMAVVHPSSLRKKLIPMDLQVYLINKMLTLFTCTSGRWTVVLRV